MLRLTAITKSYATAGGPLHVLRGVDLQLAAGEAVAVTGPSGSGKSTLLNVIGLLEPPDGGTYQLDGVDMLMQDEAGAARARGEKIGFIFQDHHLLPQLSALENVLVPTLPAPHADAANRAAALLERVRLTPRASHRPAALSGGERQRVAIARALIRRPALLIADEPTGNLDPQTAGEVAELLQDARRESNAMLIVVTHSLALAERFSRRLRLVDGRLIDGPAVGDGAP